MSALTLRFEDISAKDLPLVGGKGANLGELSRAGFNVPAGFCVTTEAFKRFMATADTDVYTLLSDVTPDDLEHLRHVGQQVRTYLNDLTLPADVQDAVLTSWREQGDGYAYAVRSSATAEDLPGASFAGQQDTYLNVRGDRYLLRRVKDCFISLFTDRAILYRVQNNFKHRDVYLSVVVQRMVQPDVAGIMFTADPVTGKRTVVSIDASYGLGEALVSGLVTADLYQVNKHDGSIIKKQIATKELAIHALPGGGVQQVAVDEHARTHQALPDETIQELAHIGKRIEAHYATPQDIEWALADDRLYITQSRPITSLYPLPEPAPTDNALHTYFSMSHFQVMTDAMPPLAMSVLRTVVPLGRAPDELESRLIKVAAGRFYVDLSPVLRHPIGKRVALRVLNNADQLAAGAFATLAERPDFKAYGARFNPLSVLPTLFPYMLKMLKMLCFGKPEGVTTRTTAFMTQYLEEVRAELTNATTTRTKLDIAITQMKQTIKPIATWVPYLVSGVVAAILLKVIAGKRVNPADLSATGRGLTGNIATDMDLAVGDLADTLRASEALKKHLSNPDIDATTKLESAGRVEGGEVFLEAWRAFIAVYGARGPSEIDLSRPRWSEDPSSLLQMVLNATAHSVAGAHRRHYQALMDEGQAATAAVVASLRQGAFGWLRAPLARRLLRVSRNLTPLREHHKFFVIQLMALVKPLLLQAGEEFEAKHKLQAADDVWFLSIPEVMTLFNEDAKDVKDIVQERKAAFARYKQLKPPRVITSEGEIPVLSLQVDAPEGALVGSPVSAGVVEGVARVVLDPAKDALHPGEILIAPFTDPGWTPLFVNAAGLVTEVGGLMTHGSVVAREYGIPAVVGVIDATKHIQTGQRIRVHGDAGYVEVLADTAETNPA